MSKSKKRRLIAARKRPVAPAVIRRPPPLRRLELALQLHGSPSAIQAAALISILLATIVAMPSPAASTDTASLWTSPLTIQTARDGGPSDEGTAPPNHGPLFTDGRIVHGSRSAARRRRARSKEEVEREQRELREATQREVDEIVAEFHTRLPRHRSKTIGAIYARYSSRFQSSVPAQLRTLFEIAVREGTFIPAELVFYDLAVRGYRDSRPGLDALREALQAKRAKVLLVFGTNRLFRKAHRAVKFVEEEIVEKGLRCYFIQQNIDTAAKKDWSLHLMIQAAIDENGTSMYAENIRAAHQGMFLRMEVNGTLALGYCGEPLEGRVTRRGRPKCKIAVDTETKGYVEKIFAWFVRDSVSMDMIARLLNDDPEAPSPPKSMHGFWTHSSVRGVLTNARYRGYWEYGKTQALYQSSKDYLRQVEREAPLQAAHFEDLRIVSDDLWYQAQALLLQERGDRGRKATKSDPATRPKLLNGILWCTEHDRALQTGGARNKAMVCKLCRATVKESRPLFTQLDRALALRLTLDKLADLICGDAAFVQLVVTACRREIAAAQQPDPTRLAQLKAQEAKKTRAIQANLRGRGDTEDDQAETDALVAELRNERTEIRSRIGLLEAAGRRQAVVPDEHVVRASLAELGMMLRQASGGIDSADARAVRRLVFELTGGKIFLSQQGERKAKRGWLQGRFRVHLLSTLTERLTELPSSTGTDFEVTIDYRPPSSLDAEADQAWALKVEGLLCVEIAARLNCSKRNVTKLLKHAAQERGVPYEDGRSRRSHLERKHREPPLFERVAPEVGRLVEEGLLLIEVAERLNLDRTTLTKAYNTYRRDQGLPSLDGRTRRKLLDHKNRPRPDDQS